MNNRMLAFEYIVAVSMVSWAAIKGGSYSGGPHIRYWPWPPAIMYTSIAFGILSLFSAVDEKLAAILGAGLMLATVIRVLNGGDFFQLSGIPDSKAFIRYGDSVPDGQQDEVGYIRILTF